MTARIWPHALAAAAYALAFCLAVKGHALRDPGTVYWANWADQARYLESATAFAHGDLDPNHHWYPLLYALLAAPFVRLTPAFPFAILNGVLFVMALAGFLSTARRFAVHARIAAPIFLITTIAYPRIGKHWIEPWTTALSAALIWLGIACTLKAIADPDEVGTRPRSAVALGALLALIPLARPADAIISVLLGGAFAWVILRRKSWSVALVAGMTALTLVVAYGALHIVIYGPTATPYMRLSAAFGLNPRWLGWKAYVLLTEPSPWFPDGEALLKVCPWLLPGAAGLLARSFTTGPQEHPARLLLAIAVSYLIVMMAYVDLLPSGLWRFNNVHYFKWILPLFGLFVWLFATMLPSRPLPALVCLVGLLGAACLRIDMVRVAPDRPARAVAFAAPAADYTDLYMGRSTIDDTRGRLLNLFDYHQIPQRPGLILAVALKREFAGRESWHGAAPADAAWPTLAPGAMSPRDLPGLWPRQPVARYGNVLQLGRPCWLPPYPCAAAIR